MDEGERSRACVTLGWLRLPVWLMPRATSSRSACSSCAARPRRRSRERAKDVKRAVMSLEKKRARRCVCRGQPRTPSSTLTCCRRNQQRRSLWAKSREKIAGQAHCPRRVITLVECTWCVPKHGEAGKRILSLQSQSSNSIEGTDDDLLGTQEISSRGKSICLPFRAQRCPVRSCC